MIVHPKIGQTVQVWYRKGVRDFMPFHGLIGTVVISGGKAKGPKNHLIKFQDGQKACVPCGNIRKPGGKLQP